MFLVTFHTHPCDRVSCWVSAHAAPPNTLTRIHMSTELTKMKWEIVVEHLPGTIDELAARTGMSRMAVQAHISTLIERGVAMPAYKIFSAKLGRRAIVVYGRVGAMPKDPSSPKTKKIAPPKRSRVHVINTPFRTVWAGVNPYEGAAQ